MLRLLLVLGLTLCALYPALDAQPAKPSKLLLAFGTYRDRPKHPNIFFYEHDGKATGKIAGKVGTVRSMASAEGHPTLSHDGRLCAFTFEIENKVSAINLWDLKENKLVDVPLASPNAQFSPTFSADGSLLLFAAWNRPGGPGQGYHVFVYDRNAKKLLDLPGLSQAGADDRMPTLSADGRWLAFASNRKGGLGLTDIYLYDRQEGKLVETPGLNSPTSDVEPSLSADGNLIAFSSDRAGGQGGRDVYVYDRAQKAVLPLSGLNTVAPEYSPSLSADGRYLVFVSERVQGEGERDIYLYDRQTQQLLPTPGLNSRTEDFDPSIIVLKGE